MSNNQEQNVIAHHGIKGQKWGKLNGPPYPLNYSDLSKEERDNAKSKAIRDGNINEANANKSHFTDQELRQVRDRFNLNMEVSKLSASTIKTGADKVDDIMRKVSRVTDWTEKGIRAYNTVAKIANSLGDSELKVIKDSKPDTGKSYVDSFTLPDGTKRTVTVKNATDKDIKNIDGYIKKERQNKK